MQLEVDVRVGTPFARGPEIVRDELDAAMVYGVNELRDEIDPRTPRGVTSILRGGNQIELSGTPIDRIGRVFNNVEYAPAVEAGTVPHFPPPGPLQLWVRRKLGITDEKEVRSVAFLIGRAISRRGTQARNFFRDGVAVARDRVRARFAEIPGRIVRRLEGGA